MRMAALPLTLGLLGCRMSTTSVPYLGPSKPVTAELPASFRTVDEAAIAVCEELHKNYPLRTSFEYSGCIYRAGAEIRVSLPDRSTVTGFCMVPIPMPNVTLLAEYHSHTWREEFSEIDVPSRVAQYLCAPSGAILRYTPGMGVEGIKG